MVDKYLNHNSIFIHSIDSHYDSASLFLSMYRQIMSPNKSLKNRRENTGAFPESQLYRYKRLFFQKYENSKIHKKQI